MAKNRNNITGDKIITKGVLSKEAEDRFDLIFRKKERFEGYTTIETGHIKKEPIEVEEVFKLGWDDAV
jgi:hypothetical protein